MYAPYRENSTEAVAHVLRADQRHEVHGWQALEVRVKARRGCLDGELARKYLVYRSPTPEVDATTDYIADMPPLGARSAEIAFALSPCVR